MVFSIKVGAIGLTHQGHVEFTCGYSTALNVSSSTFRVNDITDVVDGIGDLASGFKLTVGDQYGAKKTIVFAKV